MNNEQGDYILIGTDLTGMRLQPGFVEGIKADGKQFATLAAAYRHIFRRNLEYAIFLWNGLPVRFSYPEDLPGIIENLIEMLYTIQHPAAQPETVYEFKTPNLRYRWQIEIEDEDVTIASTWDQVPGRYESALNQLGMIRMPRREFLCEWKIMLRQISQAMTDAQALLTRAKAREQLQRLNTIEAGIPARGYYYQD